jgi:hypothetical protein
VVENKDDDFDDAFDQAVKAAEQEVQSGASGKASAAASEEDDEVDAADGATDADAKALADKKAADDKAAADKATADAAAADAAKKAAEAASGKTPEELAAEADAAKKAADAAAAAPTKTADQIAADAKAAEQARAQNQAAAQQRAAAEKAAADAAAADAEQNRYKPFVPSADEQKVIEDYKKEWPDIARAQELLAKQLEGALTERLLNVSHAVLQRVYQDVHPVLQHHTSSALDQHEKAIRQAHTDFDAVIDAVPAWIEKQPKYLQPALKAAFEEGTTEAVIDLVTRFKESTGRVTPQKPEQTPVVTPKPATDPAAAAALAPVSSKRSTAAPSTTGKDPNDFDGAFDEAVGRK